MNSMVEQTLQNLKELDLDAFAQYFQNKMQEQNQNQQICQFSIENFRGDEADQSGHELSEAVEWKMKKRNYYFIKKIKHSLGKIEAGTFGECDECEAPIGLERLKARPEAHLCVHCKDEQEREEMAQIHNLSKAMMFKKVQNNENLSLAKSS